MQYVRDGSELLYLPRGVHFWMGSYSFDKDAKLGRVLIEVVCAFAWAHGFSCDHTQVIYDKKRSSKKMRVDRCLNCGMTKTYAVKNANIAKSGAKWRYASIAVNQSNDGV